MLSMGRAAGDLAPCGMLARAVVCDTMCTLRPVVWMGTAEVIARRQRQWGADNDRGSIGHLGVCAYVRVHAAVWCPGRHEHRDGATARAQGRRDGTTPDIWLRVHGRRRPSRAPPAPGRRGR